MGKKAIVKHEGPGKKTEKKKSPPGDQAGWFENNDILEPALVTKVRNMGWKILEQNAKK